MIINFLLLGTFVFAQNFSSREDKRIVFEVIEAFSKQCAYNTSIESNIVRKLEDKLKLSQSNHAESALSCYRENLTQVTSVYYIYSNTCNEINVPNFKGNDETYMRLFVAIQKYRKGIRLPHSILNDCLRGKKVDPNYIVDLEFNRIESDLLREKLDAYKVKDIFTPNRTTYR